MRKDNAPSQRAPLGLDELRQAHLADRPAPLRREALLAALREIRFAPNTSPAVHHQPVMWAKPIAATSLATGLLAALVGVLLIERDDPQRIEPEPPADGAGSQFMARAGESGAQGLGGSSAGACVRARGDDGLLADFEQSVAVPGAQLTIRPRDGRSGNWFHQRNIGGQMAQPQPLRILESPEATHENRQALRIAGPATTGWGANAGVQFDRCYDGSAYAGVEFRARGSGLLFVGLQTSDSIPVEFGGRCTQKCWFTAGRHIVLSDRFATHRIRWEDVSSPDPSYEVPKELMQLMFSVQSGPEPYEFWLDDLRFIPESE